MASSSAAGMLGVDGTTSDGGGASRLSALAKEFTPGGAWTGGKASTGATGECQLEQCVQEESWMEATGLGDERITGDFSGCGIEEKIMKEAEAEEHVEDGEECLLQYGTEGAQAREHPAMEEVDWKEEMSAEVQFQTELLEVVADSFPDCSPDSVQVALAKSDWILDRASSALLVALQAVCDTGRTWKPCRHLLSGGCFRKDCMFDHNFARTTCRYWLQGRCLNGDECLFMHDLNVPLATDDAEGHLYEECFTEKVDVLELGRKPELARERENVVHEKPFGIGKHDFPSLDSYSSKVAMQRSSYSPGSVLPSSVSMSSSSIQCIGNALPSHHWGSPSETVERAISPALASNRTTNAEQLGSAAATVELEPLVGSTQKEDLVLAAAISAASEGGVVRRKGRRGRKTQYSAVSIQTLLRSAPSSDKDGLKHATSRRSTKVLPNSGDPGVSNMKDPNLSFADVVGSPANQSHEDGGEKIPRKLGAVVSVRSTPKAGMMAAARNRGGDSGSRETKRPLEWISTGDVVAAQYEASREEAAELARARNKCFMEATQAFRRGQGLVARDLARRGREFNVKMKEKHRLAAVNIFNSRNPGEQVFTRRCMDLHGLHVAEAVTVLDEQLAALSTKGLNNVRILAGSGHHSKGPTSKARLIPAVEKYCESRGMPYQRIADQGTGHVGMIDVSLATLEQSNETVSRVLR